MLSLCRKLVDAIHSSIAEWWEPFYLNETYVLWVSLFQRDITIFSLSSSPIKISKFWMWHTEKSMCVCVRACFSSNSLHCMTIIERIKFLGLWPTFINIADYVVFVCVCVCPIYIILFIISILEVCLLITLYCPRKKSIVWRCDKQMIHLTTKANGRRREKICVSIQLFHYYYDYT